MTPEYHCEVCGARLRVTTTRVALANKPGVDRQKIEARLRYWTCPHKCVNDNAPVSRQTALLSESDLAYNERIDLEASGWFDGKANRP